jgi:Ser/Thr protein kinase RdoA (MazF antagonist)
LDPATGLRRPELAKQQFAAMTRASAAMGLDPVYRVAQPYLLLEAESLVAAEWIPGTTLTARLTRWLASRSNMEHDLRQTGIWVSKLHQALAVAPGSLDSLQRGAVLSDWAYTKQCKDGLPKRALDMLRESAADAARRPLRKCQLHGDFKPDNMLLTAASTAGIDIQLRHENCAVYDLAAFLNHLDILCREPSGWHLYPIRNRLQAAFLESYFEQVNDLCALPLLWI